MNPGTTIIIVLGIIGLLLYASKALKATVTENFALVSDEQISNKGSEAMADLKTGALSMQSLFSAFGTPDMLKDPPTTVGPPIGGLGMGGPSPADFTEFNKPEPAIPDFKPPPPLVPPTTALPVIGPTGEAAGLPAMPTPAPMPASLIPASLLPPPSPPQPKLESPEPVNPFNNPAMTMSDKQGAAYQKGISGSAESFDEGLEPDIPGTSMSNRSGKKPGSGKKPSSGKNPKSGKKQGSGSSKRSASGGKKGSSRRNSSGRRASSSRAKKAMSKNSLKAAAKSEIQKAALAGAAAGGLASAAAGGLTVLRDDDGKSSRLTKFKGPKVIYKDRKCPPMPDMSLYIRKDAIPCWGCNLK